MKTPKRGDTKKINGKTHRWAFKDGKWQWVRDYSKDRLSAKEGLKVKEFEGTKNQIGNFISDTASKLGLHNKRNTKSTTNQKYSSDKWTKSPNTQLKTWRVDSNENRQLQTERKEGKDETYTRVTSKNKNNLSSQQNKKDSNQKTLGNETEQQFLERTKNSPAAKAGLSDKQRWAARQNYLRFQEERRASKEARRKRNKERLERKKNALKINKR